MDKKLMQLTNQNKTVLSVQLIAIDFQFRI